MRKGLLVGLVLAAALLAGCDGRLLVRMDIPIVIEPEPRYDGEAWGYLSYDPYTEHIRLDSKPYRGARYRPLNNAAVTVVGLGRTVVTDRDGYFYIYGVPYGRLELLVKHSWIRPRSGVYFTTYGR
ncbi:peptidase associated/transthyretin-like domain-containing protein [Candidatus Darwinibacter acetoxidans]|jgi:hypothetical protein